MATKIWIFFLSTKNFCIFFENVFSLMSRVTMSHCHVFIREKTRFSCSAAFIMQLRLVGAFLMHSRSDRKGRALQMPMNRDLAEIYMNIFLSFRFLFLILQPEQNSRSYDCRTIKC